MQAPCKRVSAALIASLTANKISDMNDSKGDWGETSVVASRSSFCIKKKTKKM